MTNEEVVRQLFSFAKNKKWEEWVNHFHAEGTWDLPGAPFLPVAGKHQGHQAIQAALRIWNKSIEGVSIEVRHFFEHDQKVFAVWSSQWRLLKTGDVVNQEVVGIFSIKEGKIFYFQKFLDTVKLLPICP